MYDNSLQHKSKNLHTIGGQLTNLIQIGYNMKVERDILNTRVSYILLRNKS